MRQLMYVSAASRKLGHQEIEAILGSARRNNPAQGVTGMLLSIDLGFLQILEGPAEGVEYIYSRILGDKRHTAQRVLVDEKVKDRLFAQWSMGFDRPDAMLKHQQDLFAATREAIEKAIPLEKAAVTARLVRSFYTVNAGNYAA